MKEYFFISGLPRSGSTLLSAILKQNPNFYADIASPIQNICDKSIDIITASENNVTVSENQRINLITGLFSGYYENVNKPVIFDSSRYWTKSTSLLKKVFPYTKILCTVRDIVQILNSFEVICANNPLYSKSLTEYNDNVFIRCDQMMDKMKGVVAVPWILLQEGYYSSSQMIMFVEYENLCRFPEKTMREIYSFIEKPYYSHDFDNVNYSNEKFDAVCNLENLHTVRKKVEYSPPKIILPPEIVKKYKDMDMEFWKKNHNPNINTIDKLDTKFVGNYS